MPGSGQSDWPRLPPRDLSRQDAWDRQKREEVRQRPVQSVEVKPLRRAICTPGGICEPRLSFGQLTSSPIGWTRTPGDSSDSRRGSAEQPPYACCSALLRPEGFDDPRLSEGQRSFFGQLGSLLLGWMQTPGSSHSPGVEARGRPKHTCPSRFYPLRDYS